MIKRSIRIQKNVWACIALALLVCLSVMSFSACDDGKIDADIMEGEGQANVPDENVLTENPSKATDETAKPEESETDTQDTPVAPTPEDPISGDPQQDDSQPVDPTPDDPQQDDPIQDDPQPGDVELNFSALETKLEEVITSQSKYNSVNVILSYSVNDGKLYVVYDYNIKNGSVCSVYSMETNQVLETQESINTLVEEIDVNKFTSITLKKASSDITVDGETYSKDGIAGDNIFARQCGIENAVMTYVGGMGTRVYGNYSSGYCRAFDLLIIDGDNNVKSVHATVDEETEYGSHWDNFFIEGKHTTETRGEYSLGENLKAGTEVQVMNAAWLDQDI